MACTGEQVGDITLTVNMSRQRENAHHMCPWWNDRLGGEEDGEERKACGREESVREDWRGGWDGSRGHRRFIG